MVNEVLSEALEICQAVKVGIKSACIRCHEREELRVDEFLLLLDCDFVREDLL